MSDGMRFPVNVQASNAVFNARYFGYRRGITIVTHSADIWMPFETRVINDVREALYVIDALCHNETDFDILEHYTDHAGYTYHVFALCRMLGFRFAPRIRTITEQYLFTVEHLEVLEESERILTASAKSGEFPEEIESAIGLPERDDDREMVAHQSLMFLFTLRHGLLRTRAAIEWCDETLAGLKNLKRRGMKTKSKTKGARG